jgi:hypothetical protein
MFSALDSLITYITYPIRQLYYLLQRITPGTNAFGRLSLPTKWAILTFLCLFLTTIIAAVGYWSDNEAQGVFPIFRFIMIVSLLAAFITVLVWWFIYFFLQEEPSKYPDIDQVINDALQQLATEKISVDSIPIYFVIGTDGVSENRAILEAANLKFPIQSPAKGEGPISVHASSDGMLIFPHTCSAISRLRISTPRAVTSESIVGAAEELDEPQGTIGADELNSDLDDREGEWGRAIEGQEDDDPIEGGTIQLDDIEVRRSEMKPTPTPPKNIRSQELLDAEDRLRYVCSRIKKARGNFCPINSMLTAIPFELIEARPEPLILAVKKDMEVLRNELQIRVANTLLVTGMENEPGFIEMTRRIGSQRIAKQRIGKGAEVWFSPDDTRLTAVAKCATATVEDKIFELFQREDALRNKQNAKLFTLLSRMRGTFAHHLARVMGAGFGFDPVKQPELADEQFLFSGCYFAACGAEKQKQAFAPNVFSKVFELSDSLQWLDGALRRDAKHRIYANWMAFFGLLCLLASMAMLAYKFLPSLPKWDN